MSHCLSHLLVIGQMQLKDLLKLTKDISFMLSCLAAGAMNPGEALKFVFSKWSATLLKAKDEIARNCVLLGFRYNLF